MTMRDKSSFLEASSKSSSKRRLQSFHRLSTVSIEADESVTKSDRLSLASVNATLGNGSSMEESLSCMEKTPDVEASPLLKTFNITKQLQRSKSSACILGKLHSSAGVSNAQLNSTSESINNQNSFTRTPSVSHTSPDFAEKQQTLSQHDNCTPPNRILHSASSVVTSGRAERKTLDSISHSSCNDSPLSVKMLRAKHEALNALHHITFAKSKCPQVNGISKLNTMTQAQVEHTGHDEQEEEVVDLPRTQPATTILMQGVVAFVDVRNGGDNRSEGVKSHLRELGAMVMDKFTKEVTHVVFTDGLMSTYKKAVKRKLPLVSVLWIEACKEAMEKVPEALYPPHQMEKYESPDPLKKFRRERSFQPNPDENLEDWLEKRKLKHRKKLLVMEEKENEEVPLPEVLRNRPAWLEGNLEQALRSVADVGSEYDEYINRSTSPTLSEEESFTTPLAVRVLRRIRHAEEVNPQNAMLQDKLSTSTPKEILCLDSEEAGMSKEENVNKTVSTNLETPRRSTRVCAARKSINFLSKNPSFGNEQEQSTSSTIVEKNSFKALQLEIREQTVPKPANEDMLVSSSKAAANGMVELQAELSQPKSARKKSLRNKMKAINTSTVNDQPLNSCIESYKEGSSMELTPNVQNKQFGSDIKEPINGDKTKLSDISTYSLNSGRALKRKLMPLTQPEVLEGSIAEKKDPSHCPYILDSPKNRKRKRMKSPEIATCHRHRHSNFSSHTTPRNKALHLRNSLGDFVVDVKSKKDKSNKTLLPTMVGTGLHSPELELIAAVIEKLGRFTLVPKVVNSTTHVVSSGPRRTVNLLKGIVRGCWIITQEWVMRSLEAGHWIEEESFEITEFSPAVQENRVARLSFGPRYKLDIFKECGAIYVSHTCRPPKEDLEDLIALCGGRVVKSVCHALLMVGKGKRGKYLCRIQETWVLDCITLNKLKPWDDYLLDDNV